MLISREAIKADAKQAIREAAQRLFGNAGVFVHRVYTEYLTMKVTKSMAGLWKCCRLLRREIRISSFLPNTSLMADIISSCPFHHDHDDESALPYTLNVSRRVSAGYGNLFDGFAIFLRRCGFIS